MKKIIVFASALALAGGVSYAMEEDGMDKDMMMEAPAPSVTLAGSGEMGFESVDDGSDNDLNLIRAYKVAFSSSSTTDGGLVFGAGMSIRDDTTEENMPVTKGSHVYVGGADGSWKLQFGGNDPGIDLAGGIGVADDNFGGEDDESIALSGSIEGATYRITMANPSATGAGDGDWSIGASYSISDISVGVGMDSESGLAIGVGTELAGLSTELYYSQAEIGIDDIDAKLMASAIPGTTTTTPGAMEVMGSFNPAVASIEAYIPTIVADTDADVQAYHLLNTVLYNARMQKQTALTTAEFTALNATIDQITDVELNEAEDNQAEVDASLVDNAPREALRTLVYVTDLADDDATINTAANTDETKIANTANDNLTPYAPAGKSVTVTTDPTPTKNVVAGTTAYTGFGAKVNVPAGEGTSFSIAYSTFKADTKAEDVSELSFYDGVKMMEVDPYEGGSVKTTLIELGVSYDLGGGATLNAGIDKKSEEIMSITTKKTSAADADEATYARVGEVESKDTTTLSATLAFSF